MFNIRKLQFYKNTNEPPNLLFHFNSKQLNNCIIEQMY